LCLSNTDLHRNLWSRLLSALHEAMLFTSTLRVFSPNSHWSSTLPSTQSYPTPLSSANTTIKRQKDHAWSQNASFSPRHLYSLPLTAKICQKLTAQQPRELKDQPVGQLSYW
jgi:hypothetical protein